jgi:hypothetical protein
MDRKSIRDKILTQKGKAIIVRLDDGMEIEVRQLSVGQMIDSANEADTKKRMAAYLINCCFVPGTQERVFDNNDFDVLMGLPAGGYYQKLIDAINSQLLPEQLEEAGKD